MSKGFELEDKLHDVLKLYNLFDCKREKDIKNIYGQQITGIDHMISYNHNKIYIQCKWENKKPSIRDINHFIASVESIKCNNCLCLFVSKKEPTKNGFLIFNSKNIENRHIYQYIYCDNNIENLVDNVVVCILKYFRLDNKIKKNNASLLINKIKQDKKNKYDELENKSTILYNDISQIINNNYLPENSLSKNEKHVLLNIIEAHKGKQIIQILKKKYNHLESASRDIVRVSEQIFNKLNQINVLYSDINKLLDKTKYKLLNVPIITRAHIYKNDHADNLLSYKHEISENKFKKMTIAQVNETINKHSIAFKTNLKLIYSHENIKNYSLPMLKNICKKYKFKNYGKLNKHDIIKHIHRKVLIN